MKRRMSTGLGISRDQPIIGHQNAERIEQTEEQLQAMCFQWHWNNYPDKRMTLWHNDNNSSDSIVGNKKKALGVVSGVADFTLVLPNAIFFVEMKTRTGTIKDKQIEFGKKMVQLGHSYFVVRSFHEFKALIQQVYGER